jgi:hypothetical protein
MSFADDNIPSILLGELQRRFSRCNSKTDEAVINKYFSCLRSANTSRDFYKLLTAGLQDEIKRLRDLAFMRLGVTAAIAIQAGLRTGLIT